MAECSNCRGTGKIFYPDSVPPGLAPKNLKRPAPASATIGKTEDGEVVACGECIAGFVID